MSEAMWQIDIEEFSECPNCGSTLITAGEGWVLCAICTRKEFTRLQAERAELRRVIVEASNTLTNAVLSDLDLSLAILAINRSFAAALEPG